MGKGKAVESLAPKATLADRWCSDDPLCFPSSVKLDFACMSLFMFIQYWNPFLVFNPN